MYSDMEQWLEIRKRVLRDGVSKRQILRETGMHWTTLEKILQHSSPPGYQRNQSPDKPKIGPYLERIRQILEQDKCAHRKQRHTAKRIWQRLQDEGFTRRMLQRHENLSVGPSDLSNRILDNGVPSGESFVLKTPPDPLGGVALLPVSALILL